MQKRIVQVAIASWLPTRQSGPINYLQLDVTTSGIPLVGASHTNRILAKVTYDPKANSILSTLELAPSNTVKGFHYVTRSLDRPGGMHSVLLSL